MTAPDERAALYEGIDRVVLPVSDMAAACAPFERLGLVVSPESGHADETSASGPCPLAARTTCSASSS